MTTSLSGPEAIRKKKPKQTVGRVLLWFIAISLLLVCGLLRWGGYLLIRRDALPDHADSAVVLQGSITGEKARIAGAVSLLQQGKVNRVLLSIPKESYWGQTLSPVARAYLQKNYGEPVSDRFDFCELGPGVNSTAQEAQLLDSCIQQHGWRSVIVVTSSYHTRRANIIWKKILSTRDPGLRLSIYGVADPEFEPRLWWRNRLYAKTWFFEFTKLGWTELVGPT